MIYILFRLMMWLFVFVIAAMIFVDEPATVEQLVYPAIYATAIVFGGSLVISLWNYLRRQFARFQTWVEAPSPERDPDSRIRTMDLQLLIESGEVRAPTRKLGMMVNPKTDFAIRPYIVVDILDRTLEGREVRFRFKLVDPNGKVRYAISVPVTFKTGENRIVPRGLFKVPRRVIQGTWEIRVLVGDRLWRTKEFLLTGATLESLAGELESDMELTSGAKRDAEKLADANPKDVLGDMLE